MHALPLVVGLVLASGFSAPVVDHALTVTLDVPGGRIEVEDRITLPEARSTVELALHGGLTPRVDGAHVTVASEAGAAVPLDVIQLGFATPVRAFVVRYGGTIVHAPRQVDTEHQRSFQETPGTIDARGVYLSSESAWFPRLRLEGAPAHELVTATLHVRGLPEGWRALSEGDEAGPNRWRSSTPTDNLHVVAGPFVEMRERKEGVDVLVWLRRETADADGAALAQRYLEVTGQYLAMYRDLIGPYPYSKFALVENFWETGYGMASFTLLGPQVIRFPFILHTSWPHELLHNWWGNGVFPDGGNWSEGLTAYLADHLTAEREGRGADYRRTTLQKVQDFVGPDPALDFPLRDFRARFSAASEAIGYGKWLMVVHMLRMKLGDDAFRAGLRALWRARQFQRASFDDVRAAFQAQTTEDLTPFFDAWVNRTGAPRLRWTRAQATKDARGMRHVEVVLEQTQAEAPFPLDVPLVVTLEDGRAVRGAAHFAAGARTATARVAVPVAPVRVDVDPLADTFRTLLPGETAPSMSRVLGARQATFVLPTQASAEERDGWRRFAASLCGSEIRCTVVDDRDVRDLPSDQAVWVLGYGNTLRAVAVSSAARFGASYDDGGFTPPSAGPSTAPPARLRTRAASLALAGPNPRNNALGIGFVGAHAPGVIDLLARKIPHYGKYGFLGFAGDAAENTLKGQWQPDASPLTVFLGASRPALAAPAPAPLATLPPPFDGTRMLGLVQQLAGSSGRAEGTSGLRDAGERVRAELVAAGFSVERPCWKRKGARRPADQMCNLVTRIPGKDPALPRVVLGAHLDTLDAAGGTAFPGADDNASGVAVLLEVARALRRAGPFLRTVELVVFSGEERGLLGSRAYVADLGTQAKTAIVAMVNLDTVGRKGARPLLVLDGNSASEWVHIFRGIGFTSGVQSTLAPEGGGASDQQAFLEAGIPAVQLFGGTHPDYHRPTDTADKVEGPSLVAAAVVAREAVAYLADRKEPLSPTGPLATMAGAATTAGAAATTPRRAALGSVPDMTFTGPGVRIDGVVEGSAAARVGMKAGDVLVRFDGAPVEGLRAYSELLKAKRPGDRVKVVVARGGQELELEVVLGER